jgi:hypothetical protein
LRVMLALAFVLKIQLLQQVELTALAVEHIAMKPGRF